MKNPYWVSWLCPNVRPTRSRTHGKPRTLSRACASGPAAELASLGLHGTRGLWRQEAPQSWKAGPSPHGRKRPGLSRQNARSPPGAPAEMGTEHLLLTQWGAGAHLVPAHDILKLGLLSTRKREPGGQNNKKLKLENKLLG